MARVFFGLLLSFALIGCISNRLPKGTTHLNPLPDLNVIGKECDSLRNANNHQKAAQLYYETALGFPSSELFVYAAWQFGEANLPDSAMLSMNKAIDNGMSNPNVLSIWGLDNLKSSGKDGVLKRLDSIRHTQRSIANFELVTEPWDSFWPYFEQAMLDTAKARQYLAQYIRNGSVATKDYYHKRYENIDNMFSWMIDKSPGHFQYSRQFLSREKIDAISGKMNQMMSRLAKLYPNATYPKAYLMPGIINGNGTQTELGLFIAGEMFTRSENMPAAKDLSKWQVNNISDVQQMVYVNMHELMHFQQSYQDEKTKGTLLQKVIEEGVCDFLVELLSDKNTLSPNRIRGIEYVLDQANSAFVLSEFKRDLNSKNLGKWMYNGGGIKDRPEDLGYALGYLICKSYYENSKDKKVAIIELLNTNDFKKILIGSAYKEVL